MPSRKAHLFREPITNTLPQSSRPDFERVGGRGVKDLVGVGVADPSEEPRVGQRPLDGVILTNEGFAKLSDRGVERFQPAAVM